MSQSLEKYFLYNHIPFRMCESYNYFEKLCNIYQVKSIDLYKMWQKKF
jgi:hypothetical protein